MFGSIGMPELIVIFVLALIIFGPRRLPELGKSIGKSIAEFKRASNDLRSSLEEEIRLEEQQQQRAARAATPREAAAQAAKAAQAAQAAEAPPVVETVETHTVEARPADGGA